MDDNEKTAELVYDIFSWIMNNVPKSNANEMQFVANVVHASSLVVEGWQEGE